MPPAVDRIIRASLLWNGSSLFNDVERQKQTDDAIEAAFIRRPQSRIDLDTSRMYAKSINTLATGQKSSGARRELLLNEAAAGFQMAHAMYPKWSYPLGYLAETEVALEQFSAARAHFIEAVQLDPRWSRLWHELGFLLAKEGDKERSLGCLLLGCRFSLDTDDALFNIQMMRHGKDKTAASVGEEAMKRICASELSYLVKCDMAFQDSSYNPSDGVIELVGLRPGLNSPLREGALFQPDRPGLIKTDLSQWLSKTMHRNIRFGGLATKNRETFKVRFQIDRTGKASEAELIQSSGSSISDKMILGDLTRDKYDKLPPGVSEIIMDLSVYMGQPLPVFDHGQVK